MYHIRGRKWVGAATVCYDDTLPVCLVCGMFFQVRGPKDYYTNKELYDLLQPDLMDSPYRYDNFQWAHCDVSEQKIYTVWVRVRQSGVVPQILLHVCLYMISRFRALESECTGAFNGTAVVFLIWAYHVDQRKYISCNR